MLKKILIIGSCGAGKSTLAEELSKKLNLPVIGLDSYYWLPNWNRPEAEKWRKKVSELVKQKQWIMEGNYQSTFDIRIPESDVIIVLNLNRFICFYQIWKRRILKNRRDKLNNCSEKIDFKLMKWVLWDYPGRGKKKIDYFLKKYSYKKIITIESKKDLKKINFNLTDAPRK